MGKKLYLSLEFFTLFILLPLLILHFHLHRYFILILWFFAAATCYYISNHAEFNRRNLGRPEAFTRKNVKPVLLAFALATIILGTLTYIYEPRRFLQFVLERPGLWALVMVLYPLLSVYPQELIYRAFLFHRYKKLFPSDTKILIASSMAFGFAHVIFSNFIAVFLCVLGGVIFGRTYQKTNSLLFTSFNHALYGCMIFTIGLGWYFYHGAVGLNN